MFNSERKYLIGAGQVVISGDKNAASTLKAPGFEFLANGGEMGARMRALDWAGTAIGDPADWPQSLRTVIRILLTSRFAMWMAWGADLTFFCNDAYLPTTGSKRDWVLGARSDVVWAEIWPDIGPRIRRVLETGESTWDEALLLYLERNGFVEETYHTFSYSPLQDDLGETVGMLCVVAEVTDRVIGERQLDFLRELSAHLSTTSTREEVIDSFSACLGVGAPDVPFGLVYLRGQDDDDLHLAANVGLERNTATTPSRAAFDDPKGPWPFSSAAVSAQRVSVPPEAVSALPLRHWQSPPSAALVAPVIISDGRPPVGYFVAGLNPHRAFNQNYQGFIELVAGQIAAAITRADDLESAKARAEALAEIDRAKTSFFSNISHEFRTPLTLMLGPIESILTRPADQSSSTDHSLLEVAHRNALRLLRLVNALLDFSRVEAARADANYQPTELFGLTAEIASTFRSACERAGLTLEILGEEFEEPAYVDPDMWEKIILNLMSNAFKFTLEGGITVCLRPEGETAVLEVSDTGVGIPDADLPRIFERFHRIHGTQGRSFEGSGIGLALVRDLVQLHGGSITVKSQLGLGATFRVEIPLGRDQLPPNEPGPGRSVLTPSNRAQSFVQEALLWLPSVKDDATDSPMHDTSTKAQTRAGTRQGRVLVADDNADLRDYVARLLQAEGYVVDAVGDGEAALEVARAQKPDLLLTDVMMPRLDGFELLKLIRNDPTLTDLPVVMLSARAGEGAQVDGLEAGADDYLAKPFSARELLARVSANLDMARTRRRAADAIRESEAKLQVEREFLASVLAKAPIGMTIVDREGRISMVNERGAELLGAINAPPGETAVLAEGAVHPDGRPYAREDYPSVRSARGERIEGERMTYLRRGSSGLERLVLEVDAVPIWGPDGVLAGAITVFDDAGARERNEEALRARVEKAIEEKEAARDEIHQLQKLETIGQLTAGIAHDFNNLLTPIVGALDIISRRFAGDSRAERIISAAQQSAERGRVLVSRLLTFGRRQQLDPQPLDIEHLLKGMSELIERSVSIDTVVQYFFEPDLRAVVADANQLELAVLNLCVNARDAMPSGGELTISVNFENSDGSSPQLPKGHYVRISVIDTGVGMDAISLQRAIEPFYSTKEVGKGTGLGLSMVHGLAAQSGGLFKLESMLDRGTTASIYLPAVNHDVDLAARATTVTTEKLVRLKILLVDDEELVRFGTAEMLEASGHHVQQAASGHKALDILRECRDFDVLVADYMMPGITGVGLAAEVQAVVPGLPALIISGYASPIPTPHVGLAQLSKPFRQVELNAAVCAAAAQKRITPPGV